MRIALVLTAAAAVLAVVPAPAQAAPGQTYSASLSEAVADLPVATEVRTGYDRDLFPHWIDADGDGCDSRREVLISEADVAPTVGLGCSLTGGSWFSYYDRVTQTDIADLQVDHMVPLAEAWDSGARSWTTDVRKAYANDLGDFRPLVAVTGSVNQSKSDQDPAEWLPTYDHCRYVRDWVSVKHRWSLAVDSGEKSSLASIASGCTTYASVSVVIAR